MDKEFLLKYLKVEHLANNQELSEVAEMSGIDVAKQLFRNHETMRMLYIPMLNKNKELLIEVIKDNSGMSIAQLATLTGCTRQRIESLREEIDRN
jgi:hypothetical protein